MAEQNSISKKKKLSKPGLKVTDFNCPDVYAYEGGCGACASCGTEQIAPGEDGSNE